mgnify:CR=1 FL=1
MGIYDLPAVIDHVLATTGQSDIFYVGHSMGTTMFYVLESEKPEYVSKVRHMISLAPIAYMEHVSNFLADLGSYFPGGQVRISMNLYFRIKMKDQMQEGAMSQSRNSHIFSYFR